MANITKLALEAALKKSFSRSLWTRSPSMISPRTAVSAVWLFIIIQRYLRSGRVGMCGGRHEGTAGEEEL